jgi:hypothetical protein
LNSGSVTLAHYLAAHAGELRAARRSLIDPLKVCVLEHDRQQRVVSSPSLRSKADAHWNVC